jgi:filamentous hemagglutinin family protein
VLAQIVSLMFHNAVVLANPTGGIPVAGSATITPSGNTVTVTQSTNRAIINWQDFSINQGEVTNFVLPGSNASVLNRVVGGNTSVLLGTLQSNGNVLLINPNGILIGPTGQINVNSFIGSTLNISDAQFMEGGNFEFKGSSIAGVENYGVINAVEGNIYLIGASVQNHGSLNAPNGTVGLAAGQDVLLVDAAHPHLTVRPTSQSLGGTGVHNNGTIEAMQAELMAAGGNIYALAINNEGTVRATGSAEVGGRVYLVADGGNIVSSGNLVAKKGENGGDVIVHAGGDEGTSAIITGNVDVSGKESGGIFFVKAGVIDVSDANINLGGAISGQMILSLGPHSVNFGEGLGGPFLNWNDDPVDAPANMTLEAGDLRVFSTTQMLDGNGGTIQEDTNADPFLDLMLESASTDEPFIQFISFNIDREGNGPAITENTDVLYTFLVREPDGTFQTQYLVLDATTFANTRIGFTATGGELIQKVTINSNQDGYTFDPMDPFTEPTPIGTPTPVMNTLKQVSDQVDVAAINLLIVQKQTNPDGSPVVFDFELTHNPRRCCTSSGCWTTRSSPSC